MKYIPISDVILIRYKKPKEKAGNIIVVEKYMNDFMRAKVVARGPVVSQVELYDEVLVHKYSGHRLGSEEKAEYDLIALREKEIIAIFKEAKQ